MASVVTALLTGVLVLLGVLVTQQSITRREHRARAWERRANAYVGLMRWRLDPPDDTNINNPEQMDDMHDAWLQRAYPLLAEASLFGGPRVRAILEQERYLFQAARRLASTKPGDLAELSRDDLAVASADPRHWRRTRASNSA
ncbi:hypothetical protein GCM10009797_33960 [Nocardioides hwasunensis]